MIDNSINDVRIIGFITAVFLIGIALIGMSWEAKVIDLFSNLFFFTS